jgi:hypothetical protein
VLQPFSREQPRALQPFSREAEGAPAILSRAAEGALAILSRAAEARALQPFYRELPRVPQPFSREAEAEGAPAILSRGRGRSSHSLERPRRGCSSHSLERPRVLQPFYRELPRVPQPFYREAEAEGAPAILSRGRGRSSHWVPQARLSIVSGVRFLVSKAGSCVGAHC